MLILRKTGLPFLPSDVQALICSSLRGRQRTLAALAQTCKSLKGPALEELWRVIPCFEVIVYTLPPDLWEVYEADYDTHIVRSHHRVAVVYLIPPLPENPTGCHFFEGSRSSPLLHPSGKGR